MMSVQLQIAPQGQEEDKKESLPQEAIKIHPSTFVVLLPTPPLIDQLHDRPLSDPGGGWFGGEGRGEGALF